MVKIQPLNLTLVCGVNLGNLLHFSNTEFFPAKLVSTSQVVVRMKRENTQKAHAGILAKKQVLRVTFIDIQRPKHTPSSASCHIQPTETQGALGVCLEVPRFGSRTETSGPAAPATLQVGHQVLKSHFSF